MGIISTGHRSFAGQCQRSRSYSGDTECGSKRPRVYGLGYYDSLDNRVRNYVIKLVSGQVVKWASGQGSMV